jgi:uncharacterized membrane protein
MAQTSARSSKRSTRPSPASSSAAAKPDAREFSALPLIILVLSLLGLGVAGYLTYAHYNQDALVCTVGSCHTVQSSKYAMIGGVPIAIFGACMYVALAALAAARRFHVGPLAFDTATMAAFGIVLAGFVYAAYLTYVELFVIDAICQWCVSSAVITTIILALESVLLWKTVLGPADAFD